MSGKAVQPFSYMLSGSPRGSNRCRVVVIDDHVSVCEMLCRFVDTLPGFVAAGWAKDREGALALFRRERPEVVILDLLLPPTTGLEILAEVKPLAPDVQTIVFSGHLQAGLIQRALEMGALGLVGKAASLDELKQALLSVRVGRIYLSRSASDEIRDLVYFQASRLAESEPLTERETSVLQGIAEGLRSKEIADRLGLSIHTVVNHRTRLMRKTGLRGVAQLSRYAAQIGLVGVPIKLATPPDPAGGASLPPARKADSSSV